MRDPGSSRLVQAFGVMRPEALIACLLLLCCGMTGLLLVAGGGILADQILRVSFWVAIAGLSAIACIFFWRAGRLIQARR